MDRDMKQRFQERFDRLAAEQRGSYDANPGMAASIKRRQRAMFYSLVEAYEPGLALDMGCGTGMYGSLLRNLGWRVLSGDMSAKMLELGEARAAGWSLQCDAEYPPIAANRLDMVLAFDLLHYFTDLERGQMIAAYAKTLRAGGTLFLDVKNGRCPYYALSGWARKHNSPHAETYTLAELNEHLCVAGMRVRITRGVPWGGPFAPIILLSAKKMPCY